MLRCLRHCVLFVVCSGCHVVLPLEGQSSRSDAPPGSTDTRPDVGVADGAIDTGLPWDILPGDTLESDDGMTGQDSQPVIDASLPPDTQPALDAPLPPDSQPALDGAPAPCSPGTTLVYSYSGPTQMVVCKGAQVTQCQASTLCGAGWHLCTASEYLDRGGTAPGYSGAWIQSCIRTNNKVTAPTETLCPSCVIGSTIIATVMWDCNGGFGIGMTTNQLTPVTATVCKRLGIDDTSTAGYWYPQSAGSTKSAAACCYP